MRTHPAGHLEQEAAEEEYAQDDGKRDDYDLDESQSHSRFLTVERLPFAREGHFIGAFGGMSTLASCPGRDPLEVSVSSKQYARQRAMVPSA
ncbi:MAG TPA: hypothetical protein VE642_14475 [Pyrinomonadaceae bacterium]|jgi:hypothetical protein|nr:hypothetical protein [Pyrinomonadaceae bacterium]